MFLLLLSGLSAAAGEFRSGLWRDHRMPRGFAASEWGGEIQAVSNGCLISREGEGFLQAAAFLGHRPPAGRRGESTHLRDSKIESG